MMLFRIPGRRWTSIPQPGDVAINPEFVGDGYNAFVFAGRDLPPFVLADPGRTVWVDRGTGPTAILTAGGIGDNYSGAGGRDFNQASTHGLRSLTDPLTTLARLGPTSLDGTIVGARNGSNCAYQMYVVNSTGRKLAGRRGGGIVNTSLAVPTGVNVVGMSHTGSDMYLTANGGEHSASESTASGNTGAPMMMGARWATYPTALSFMLTGWIDRCGVIFGRAMTLEEQHAWGENPDAMLVTRSRSVFLPVSSGISGSANITLADATTSSAATLDIAATSAITLADATTSSAAALDIAATSGITLADATTSSAATLDIAATSGITLADTTVVSAATVSSGISGSANITLADATTSSAATLDIAATSAITLADATTSSAATLDIAATSATTLADTTVVATGALGDVVAGAAAITLADATTSSAATLDIAATSAITLADATTSSAATVSSGISGSAGITLADATASGTAVLYLAATSAITLADTTASGTAVLYLVATSGITLADTTVASAGTEEVHKRPIIPDAVDFGYTVADVVNF